MILNCVSNLEQIAVMWVIDNQIDLDNLKLVFIHICIIGTIYVGT